MSIPFFKFFLTNAKSQCEKSHDIWYAQCVRVRPSEIYYSMRRRSPNRNNQKIHSLFIVSFTVPLLDYFNYSTNRFICQALSRKIYKKEGIFFPFFLASKNVHVNILGKQSQMLSHYHLSHYD